MNRKDFELLADWCFESKLDVGTVTSLAGILSHGYTHFNKEKFLQRALNGRKR